MIGRPPLSEHEPSEISEKNRVCGGGVGAAVEGAGGVAAVVAPAVAPVVAVVVAAVVASGRAAGVAVGAAAGEVASDGVDGAADEVAGGGVDGAAVASLTKHTTPARGNTCARLSVCNSQLPGRNSTPTHVVCAEHAT